MIRSTPAPTVGVHLPPQPPAGLRFDEMARLVEGSGFDSLWLSDHCVLVEGATSRYPFSEDGRFFQSPDSDWFDWVVTLAFLAAHTSRVRLGVSVAIVPLRQPLVLAKQIATLDQLADGRITLGAGTGWLAEEFAALQIPFRDRGSRLDDALGLIRAAWTGTPPGGDYGLYTLPAGVRCHPTPKQSRVPVLIGGAGSRALARIVRIGDGWAIAVAGGRPDPAWLEKSVAELHHIAHAAGRDPQELTVDVRISARSSDLDRPEFMHYLRHLIKAGATSLSFDVNWHSDRVPMTLGTLRDRTLEVTP